LGLETVPCRIRADLEDDHSILFTLIEDNRHQRERDALQKQREVAELMEIIKARRQLTGDIQIDHQVKLGKVDLSKVSGMAPEAAEKLDEAIEEAKKEIKSDRQKSATYHIALQMGGQEKKQYAKAKKVNEAVDKLNAGGKPEEAQALKELALKNLSAAERSAKVALGEGAEKKPNRTIVRKKTVASQCDNCLLALQTLINLLQDQNDPRVRTAIKIVETIRDQHEKSNDDDETVGD